MGRYAKRQYVIDDWYLLKREGTPAWYACRYDKGTNQVERFTLYTTDKAQAKKRLIAAIRKDKKQSKTNGKPTVNSICQFIRHCISERRKWANSKEGVAILGPGSPTIPGMQEYYRILHYAKSGQTDPLAER